MSNLGKAISESLTKSHHAETVELYSNLLTATYDKATSYLNVVTLAGYAAFFGLWSLVGNDITSGQRKWAGVLLGVSVLLFVGFEIVKASVFHWQIRALLRVSKSQYDPLLVHLRKTDEIWQRGARRASRISVGVWIVVFPLTVFTGVAGAAVLLFALAQNIYSGSAPSTVEFFTIRL